MNERSSKCQQGCGITAPTQTSLMGMWDGAVTSLENSLAALQKFNIESPYDPEIPLLLNFKNVCINMCSSITQSSQKMETIQTSISWWEDKQNVT